MTLVMDYLNMWPVGKTMKDWQSIILSNVRPRMRTSTHLSVLSSSPIVAAFARSRPQASIMLSDDDDIAIFHEDITNVCGHNTEEVNGGVRNDDQEIVNSVLTSYRKRRRQQVVTKQARVKVTKWMVEDVLANGQKVLFARAVRFFPGEFRGSVNSNSMKASRWFKSRDEILAAEKNDTLSLSQKQFEIRRVVRLKTKKGRGRKTAPWVLWLHAELCSGFDRLRKAGVKFSPQLLKNLALDVVNDSTHP
jgi:hypothetical protein